MKNKRIIKNNHEFQQIIAKKNTITNTNYVLYFVKNDTDLKYGISVGKKIGNAVERNKIKRQIRMMFKEIIKEYGNLEYKVVILVRKRFIYKDFSLNNKLLNSLFKELCKIKK